MIFIISKGQLFKYNLLQFEDWIKKN